MRNSYLVEEQNIAVAIAPQEANAAAVTTGRIDMSKCDRVALVLNVGAGGQTEVTFHQHVGAAGGTPRLLTFKRPVYVKPAGTDVFEKIGEDSGLPADKTAVVEVLDADAGVAVIEILAEDMDDDCRFISATLSAPGAAKQVSAMFVLGNMRYQPAYTQKA